MSTPKPTAAELAHARATIFKRAPTAPDWVPERIARARARKRAEIDRDREARARRELIEHARRCDRCSLPLPHVARPDDREVCTCHD